MKKHWHLLTFTDYDTMNEAFYASDSKQLTMVDFSRCKEFCGYEIGKSSLINSYYLGRMTSAEFKASQGLS